jgi:hypothetical protein
MDVTRGSSMRRRQPIGTGMQHPHAGSSSVLDAEDLVARLADDPWSLPATDRERLRRRHETAQRRWLDRLRRLVEPPAPDEGFPAFLLDLPPFARLARDIGEARGLGDLDVGTADELQRFVDRYRDYLTAAAL